MSRELQRLGCRVVVYGRPGENFGCEHDGVLWLPCESYPQGPPGDVFIAWRHAEFAQLATGWKQRYHWLHNRQEKPYPADIAKKVDRILLVSRHHGTDIGFRDIDRRKMYYTSNGLDEGFLRDPGHNEPDRAIYASCPARGLLKVLEMWPLIRHNVPDAKLDIYNGFTPVYEEMARYYDGLSEMKETILERIARSEGVTFHGMVGQDLLAEGFARSGVWLYPTETPETSCITAMKALAMGCLPVTSGYGALTETLGGRDLGPIHEEKPISQSRFRLWSFRRRTVRAMLSGRSKRTNKLRREWSSWARERYSWKKIARDWLRLFAEVEAENRLRRIA
jgi:glycosyltransferase involved in cell wall biosynthesis